MADLTDGGARAQAACPSRRQRTWRLGLTVLTAARGTCRCRRCRAPLSRSRTRPVRLVARLLRRRWLRCVCTCLLRHACTAGSLQAWVRLRAAAGPGEVTPCAAQVLRLHAGACAGAARPSAHLAPSDLLSHAAGNRGSALGAQARTRQLTCCARRRGWWATARL